jgi:hypothetical protein
MASSARAVQERWGSLTAAVALLGMGTGVVLMLRERSALANRRSMKAAIG